jgi:pimeloyl-ACP methyl ester carboxylesterase
MTTIELTDGRLLDIADAGGDGHVLLFHHGTPGSVTHLPQMAEAAGRCGLRMVSYSRAGYGASTRQAGRSVADVVTDMTQVLDHVGPTGASPPAGREAGRMRWPPPPCCRNGQPAPW